MRTNQTEDLNPGSKSATHVQTFAGNFGMTRFWQLNLDKFGLLRRKLGIQFVSIIDLSRLSRPRRRWRDQNVAIHICYVHCFATKICHFQSFASENFSRDIRYQDGDDSTSATQKTVQPNSAISRLSRPRCKRRDFCDEDGDRANMKNSLEAFAFEVMKTALP